jgi:PPOX class probable F420-dependent enzyme
MGVVPQQDLGLLESKALMHVATIGPKGEPQSSPVWFGWDGKYVSISQTKARQKYRNLVKDKRIALSIVDPENPYHYLEIRGTVVRVEEDPEKHFIDSMAQKYLGVEKYPGNQPGDERVVLYIEPERISRMG